MCAKHSGKRRAKLDKHNFSGIFIGFMGTMIIVRYIDLNTGLVKNCEHATFNEAWYCSQARPPAAQLLYDLGLASEEGDLVEQSAKVGTALPPPCPTTHRTPSALPVAENWRCFR